MADNDNLDPDPIDPDPIDGPVANTDNSDNKTDDPPTPRVLDHNKRALLADLYKERSARKSLSSQVKELTQRLEELDPLQTELDQIKSRYARLEEFILNSDSSLARALDSRKVTSRLYETDDSIDDILSDWNKSNPTHTSRVLTGSSSQQSSSKPDISELLRIASGL